VCVPDEHRKRFEHEYTIRSAQNPQDKDGYNTRHRSCKYNAWGIEFRVYFKTATDWVVDSLKKLGFHTEISDKLIAVEFIGNHPEHGYTHRVTSQELFWKLVDYGYRLGQQDSIPYQQYEMQCALQEMKTKRFTIIPMIHVEAENPVVEAKMFAEIGG